jgi:uncharacterized protein
VDFFVYSRAAPGAAGVEHDAALDEEHWSYMDAFADGMTARGPTLARDRTTWTGSLHIVDLPSAEAAREFVEREPYNRAGLFEEHVIRRFDNRLGRTMWQFAGAPEDRRFLVIGHGAVPLPDGTALAQERLIVHGDLLSADETRPVGMALALQAPAREAVAALLRVDDRSGVEIHDWEFGGRR